MRDLVDMDDVFRRMISGFRNWSKLFPEMERSFFPVDVQDTGKEIVVKADLPGINKEDISLKVTDSELCISAREEQRIEEEKENYYRKERMQKAYQRTLRLPEKVDSKRARAKYKQGVLTVHLPKVEDSGEGRINIE